MQIEKKVIVAQLITLYRYIILNKESIITLILIETKKNKKNTRRPLGNCNGIGIDLHTTSSTIESQVML